MSFGDHDANLRRKEGWVGKMLDAVQSKEGSAKLMDSAQPEAALPRSSHLPRMVLP